MPASELTSLVLPGQREAALRLAEQADQQTELLTPTLVFGQSGSGRRWLARRIFGQWSRDQVLDVADMQLVMGDSDAERQLMSVGELLRSLSFAVKGRRGILLNLQGASPLVQNALLKSLEEPVAGVWTILVATSPGLVLPTINSRCRQVRVGPLSDEDLRQAASENGWSQDPGTCSRANGSLARLQWLSDHPGDDDLIAKAEAKDLIARFHEVAPDQQALYTEVVLNALYRQGGRQSIQGLQALFKGSRPLTALTIGLL